MGGKDHDTRGEPGFIKRRNRISGQFRANMIERIESPAWRALSLSARRLIDRIEIELAHHSGNDNGRLPVTFEDFMAYGIHHNAIAPAMREAEALGFIRVTERGCGGNSEFKQPNKFFLTFAHSRESRANPRTDDWRKIKTLEEATEIAHAARDNKNPRAVQFAQRRAQKIKSRYRKTGAGPIPETGSETTKFPIPETGITVSPPKPVPPSVRGRYSRARSTPEWSGYTKLPIQLRLMALGLPIPIRAERT